MAESSNQTRFPCELRVILPVRNAISGEVQLDLAHQISNEAGAQVRHAVYGGSGFSAGAVLKSQVIAQIADPR